MSRRGRKREKGAICFEYRRDGERRRGKVVERADHDLTLREVLPDRRDFSDRLPTLPIPASGSEDDTCGEALPVQFCADCGEPKVRGRTCGRPRCPRCWSAWARRKATTWTAKLEALYRYKKSQGKKMKKHHVTVSLPDDFRLDSADPTGRTFNIIKSVMQQVNADTGYIIYHPFRIKKEYRGAVAGHDSGDGSMNWADIIGRDDWGEYVVFQPHFHVICLSVFVQGGEVTRNIEEKTGLLVERITKPDSSVSIRDDIRDLARVVAYSLSHAGLKGGERWNVMDRPYGEVANFEPKKHIEAEAEAAVRGVAPKVLGQTFPAPYCDSERIRNATEQIEITRHRTLAAPDDWRAGSLFQGSGERTATGTELTEVDVERPERCGGRLLPIRAALDYLRNDDWREAVGEDVARELRDAHARFEAAVAGEDRPPPEPAAA